MKYYLYQETVFAISYQQISIYRHFFFLNTSIKWKVYWPQKLFKELSQKNILGRVREKKKFFLKSSTNVILRVREQKALFYHSALKGIFLVWILTSMQIKMVTKGKIWFETLKFILLCSLLLSTPETWTTCTLAVEFWSLAYIYTE